MGLPPKNMGLPLKNLVNGDCSLFTTPRQLKRTMCRASEVIWSEYTSMILSALSDNK